MFKFFKDVPPRGFYKFQFDNNIVDIEIIGVTYDYFYPVDDEEILLVNDGQDFKTITPSTWSWMKHLMIEPMANYDDLHPGTYFKCNNHIFNASIYKKENMDDCYSYLKDGIWRTDSTFTPEGNVLIAFEESI
jgi:hypothetical protein